jgi:dUTP pyrophosphatase
MDSSLEFLKQKGEELKRMLDQDLEGMDYDDIFKELGVDMKQMEYDLKNYKPKMELPYVKSHIDTVSPSYNYDSDSGFDLYSVEEIEIPAFGRALVPTGLSFDIKDGYEIQVRTKSGLAINQGLMVLNSPGTVDNGYTGEVKVIIFNTNSTSVTIHKGMKVGQAVVCPVVNGGWVNLVEVDEINEKERGENGFGSTGII